MMNKFLTEVKGFTPVIDALAAELGLIPAAVYGVAWRYCQMEDHICRAKLETIAAHIGVSRATVKRHIKELCRHGYLKDLTPDLRAKPHIYADTGKVLIRGLVEARVGEMTQTDLTANGSERPIITDEIGQRDPLNGSERPISKEHEERNKDHDSISSPGGEKSTASAVKKKPQPHTDGQRRFLGMFGAKRYRNQVQAETVLKLEQGHGTASLLTIANKAAKLGLPLGRAVLYCETALESDGSRDDGAKDTSRDGRYIGGSSFSGATPAQKRQKIERLKNRGADVAV